MKLEKGIGDIICFNCILFALLFTNKNTYSQNLIIDGSFEEYCKCPKNLSMKSMDFLINWFQPYAGSTDYLNSCSKGNANVFKNSFGKQPPNSGDGYIGLCVYNDEILYREYIAQKLKERTTSGKKYFIRYYVSLADKSAYSTCSIDYSFADTVIREQKYIIEYIETIHDNNVFVNDMNDWFSITDTFTLRKNYKYIFIGNFKDDLKTKVVFKQKSKYKVAYYYIDNVFLLEFPESDPKSFEIGLSIKFEDAIKINENSNKITSINFNSDFCDSLVKILKSDPLIEINLSVSDAYNLSDLKEELSAWCNSNNVYYGRLFLKQLPKMELGIVDLEIINNYNNTLKKLNKKKR